MKLIERLARRLVPPLPKQRYMCIRCDEVRDDVPGPWSRCEPCRRLVAEIALMYPDVYLEYTRRLEAARGGRRSITKKDD